MDDFKDRVAAWLAKSGFPLEMRVAALWEQAGFDVTQGVYYIDPETSTPRETDVVASKDNVTAEAWARWFTVVECKSGREAPWVLFPRRGIPLDARTRIMLLSASRGTRPFLSRISRRPDVERTRLFNSERPPAYGMVQAMRENPDHAYAAVTSVAKAASVILEDVSKNSEGEESLEIVWPVIVTEAPLFEAQLSAAGKIEVAAVERGTLLWRHPTAGKAVAAIDVVRADGVESYVSQVKEAVDLILWNTEKEMADTLQKRRENAAKHHTPSA